MLELYAPFTRTGAPIMVMDCASAELTKYAANAMLATRISFMNEVANVCELVGADVDQVRRAIGADRRIGTSFLFPGIGYGGSCFPEGRPGDDPFRRDRRTTTSRFCARSRTVNALQKTRLFAKMKTHFGSLKGKTVASGGWRSSRRPTTCARRRSVPLIEALLAAGAKVQAYDPEAMQVAKGIFGDRDHLRGRATTMRSRAPTAWRSSPSGTSSGGPTSRGCGR